MTTTEITIHPADELAALREEIKQLEKHEADLRTRLLGMTDAERTGDQYRAFVINSSRETVDKAALIAAFGRETIDPYIKVSAVQTLKTARKDHAGDTD